ncbi:hypothetical protein ACX9R5_06630 [Rathayibacter sp. CAU 1779]
MTGDRQARGADGARTRAFVGATPPMPEGVNLLGTPITPGRRRSREPRHPEDVVRRRRPFGLFGLTFVWSLSALLLLTALYTHIAAPIMTAALPTAEGTVQSWITNLGRHLTYSPRIAYTVGGHTYRFTSTDSLDTLTGAPKTVTVSYLPTSPSQALWNAADRSSTYGITPYLVIVDLVALILLAVAIYQLCIIRNRVPRSSVVVRSWSRQRVGWGVLFLAGGGIWLATGYLSPVSWYLPPAPNLAAVLLVAFGVALIVAGVHDLLRKAADAPRPTPE